MAVPPRDVRFGPPVNAVQQEQKGVQQVQPLATEQKGGRGQNLALPSQAYQQYWRGAPRHPAAPVQSRAPVQPSPSAVQVVPVQAQPTAPVLAPEQAQPSGPATGQAPKRVPVGHKQ